MIRRMNQDTIAIVSEMALKLWPESDLNEHLVGFSEILKNEDEVCFILAVGDTVAGFVHASSRFDYVEGSNSSPVGYIEGIFVEDGYRRQGYSKQLIDAVESWAQSKGYSELASDCEIDNTNSLLFHKGLRFEEANRVICFIKKLKI